MATFRCIRIRLLALLVSGGVAVAGAGFLVGRNFDSDGEAAREFVASAVPAAPSEPTSQIAPLPEARRAESGREIPASTPRPARGPRGTERPRQDPIERLVVVPAGTKIRLRLISGLSSQTAAPGEAVAAELAAPVAIGGEVVVPEGVSASGRVTEVQALRRIGGQAHLALAFDQLAVGGRSVPIAAYFTSTGKNETGKDVATIAGGALVGTVLGNQAKHNDRGKVVGGLLGAGIGTAIAAGRAGDTIELPSGSILDLTLRSDVQVRVRS